MRRASEGRDDCDYDYNYDYDDDYNYDYDGREEEDRPDCPLCEAQRGIEGRCG